MKVEVWRFKCETLFQNHLVALGARADGVFPGVVLYFVPNDDGSNLPDDGRNLRKFSKETFNDLQPELGSILGEATGGLTELHRAIFTMQS